jgi:hypothetical protein
MPEAADKPIPISEASKRILRFYPAAVAGPRMMRGLADGQIHCAYGELVEHRAPEPTPDKPGFWRPDPRGQTCLTPFPWPEDWVRRSVQPRGYRRPLCSYVALELTVVWADVIALFPAVAQAEAAEEEAAAVTRAEAAEAEAAEAEAARVEAGQVEAALAEAVEAVAVVEAVVVEPEPKQPKLPEPKKRKPKGRRKEADVADLIQTRFKEGVPPNTTTAEVLRKIGLDTSSRDTVNRVLGRRPVK